jgi:hypothetical protein
VLEYILELAMLSIDLHPAHLDELDAWPESDELELERRYARSRELNPELYVLGARCCLVSRQWNVISRRLLYTSIKMDVGRAPRTNTSRQVIIRNLEQSPSNAAIVTSFSHQSIPEPFISEILPLLPNLVQLELHVTLPYHRDSFKRDAAPFRHGRFEHLRRLSIQYPPLLTSYEGRGCIRSLLRVISTISTLERLDLGTFESDWWAHDLPRDFDYGHEREWTSPCPSFSLVYLRLAYITFVDYDLSPLVVASASTLKELVLDEFWPMQDRSIHLGGPAKGYVPLRQAITNCSRLERLTLREVPGGFNSDPDKIKDDLYPLHNFYPSLQYLFVDFGYRNDEVVRQHLSCLTIAPKLRHLSIRQGCYNDVVETNWIGGVIVDKGGASMERWTFDTGETRGDMYEKIWYSTDPKGPRYEFNSYLVWCASSVGVRLVGPPGMSRWRSKIGQAGETFYERMDLLDLRELLALRGSHLVSRMHIVENHTDASTAGNGRPGDDDGAGLRDQVGVAGVEGSRL